MMMILEEGWVWLADLPARGTQEHSGRRYSTSTPARGTQGALLQEVLNEHSGKRHSRSTPARGTQGALLQEALKEDSCKRYSTSTPARGTQGGLLVSFPHFRSTWPGLKNQDGDEGSDDVAYAVSSVEVNGKA